MNAHIINFPRQRQARIVALFDRTEQALAAARVVCRTAEHQDDATLAEACRVLTIWGDTRDIIIARTIRQRIDERAALALHPSSFEAARILRGRRRTRFQLIVGAMACAVFLAIAWGAPAKIAATILQAQEQGQW